MKGKSQIEKLNSTLQQLRGRVEALENEIDATMPGSPERTRVENTLAAYRSLVARRERELAHRHYQRSQSRRHQSFSGQ